MSIKQSDLANRIGVSQVTISKALNTSHLSQDMNLIDFEILAQKKKMQLYQIEAALINVAEDLIKEFNDIQSITKKCKNAMFFE